MQGLEMDDDKGKAGGDAFEASRMKGQAWR